MLTDCIVWSGGRSMGYGITTYDGRPVRAHRVAWLTAGREIPEGHQIHHVCGNRLCVNVDHLECMSASAHARLHNQRKHVTHCPKGHEYTPENTYLKNRWRQCRACERERSHDYYRRNRERLIAKAVAYKRAKREEATRHSWVRG